MSKITKSAKGEECLIRIPGVCNHNPETVVFCHENGGGMGMKQPETEGAYGCSACHDAVDFRVQTQFPRDAVQIMFYQGQRRTRAKLVEKGLIVIK